MAVRSWSRLSVWPLRALMMRSAAAAPALASTPTQSKAMRRSGIDAALGNVHTSEVVFQADRGMAPGLAEGVDLGRHLVADVAPGKILAVEQIEDTGIRGKVLAESIVGRQVDNRETAGVVVQRFSELPMADSCGAWQIGGCAMLIR
jgi:hypothetical protein